MKLILTIIALLGWSVVAMLAIQWPDKPILSRIELPEPFSEITQKIERVEKDWILTTNAWYRTKEQPNGLVSMGIVIEYTNGPHTNAYVVSNTWIATIINDSVKCAQINYAEKRLKEYEDRLKPLNCSTTGLK